MYPTPPKLEVKPGLVLLDKELIYAGILFNHPSEPNTVVRLIFERGNEFSMEPKYAIRGEVKDREGYVYWDMLEGKYV